MEKLAVLFAVAERSNDSNQRQQGTQNEAESISVCPLHLNCYAAL